MRPCAECGGKIPTGQYGNVRYCSDPCRSRAKAWQMREQQKRVKVKRRSMRAEGLRRGPVDQILAGPPDWVRDLAPGDRVRPIMLQGLAVGGPFERVANMLLREVTPI